jgi:hypothetical protein
VLLFQATGNARIDGRSAPLQATTTGQGACDHAKSFFMPIPAGTSSVTVSDGGGACVGFYARDFQIISPLAPGASPTDTETPAAVPEPDIAPVTDQSAPTDESGQATEPD